MPVQVVTPTILTSANITSSTITENDYANYNAGTTYNIGDRVISTTTHRIYECVQDGALGKNPTDINNRIGTTTLWWVDIGPTNKHAMFDFQSSSVSSATTSFTVVLTPGQFDTIFAAGLSYGTINVTVKDAPGGNVIVSTGDVVLEGSIISDYWDYFFAPFFPLTEYLLQEIPIYANAEVTIVFTSYSGNATCAAIVFGTTSKIGRMLAGGKVKPKTYSYINTDDFGNNVIVKRTSATDLNISVAVELKEANFVVSVMKHALDTPSLWIACDEAYFRSLRSFGLGSGELSYDSVDWCTLPLTVQGLL